MGQHSEERSILDLPDSHSMRGDQPFSLAEIAALPDSPSFGSGRKSNLSHLPAIAALHGSRFADLDVAQAAQFTELQSIAGTVGLILAAEVHSGPENDVVQPPEGMNDTQLVGWYIANNAVISVNRFVADPIR